MDRVLPDVLADDGTGAELESTEAAATPEAEAAAKS